MDPATLHKGIQLAFKSRNRAYAPYSKFRVGAALLTADGTLVGGCNVENASYGAGICAERTAVTKAISEGHTRIVAAVVVSDVPAPTTSPCGICRQVLREFMPLEGVVYVVSAAYETEGLAGRDAPPAWMTSAKDKGAKLGVDPGYVLALTVEELLPVSFGPENLGF